MRAAGAAFILAALLAMPFAATAGATQHANAAGMRSGDPVFGGPGERIAVGRDREIEVAQAEAEAEADDVCHGDWDLRDFAVRISPPKPVVYTLTYECS